MRLNGNAGIPFPTKQGKGPSSRDEEGKTGLLLSRGGTLGVPLELQWGFQGPFREAPGKSSLHASCEGPLWIPLQSVPDHKSSSGAEATTSGFLSSAYMDLGVPLELRSGS